MSVMEMSHRGKAFVGIAQQAEADLRELLAVPANYKVLFLQGGATAQFAAVPLNLAAPGAVADYVNTGAWSKKAIGEAQALSARSTSPPMPRDASYTHVPAQCAVAAHAGRGVPALHAERDHRRRRVSVRSRHRRRAAGRRHVVDDPVAADRCRAASA